MIKPQKKFELHIDIDSQPLNAVDTIMGHLPRNTQPISKADLKLAMLKGAVWLSRNNHNQRLRRAKKPLLAGDKIHVYYDTKVLTQTPQQPELIADLQDYSVWYKPYGVYSQGSKWSDHCTIDRLASLKIERETYLVHRLDRATTGLILLAHSKKAAALLSGLFAQRLISKQYVAIVKGIFASDPKDLRIETEIDGKAAASIVSLVTVNAEKNQSKVIIDIETGRKHQIRKHLSGIGFPIVGDRLYGEAKEHDEDLKLCCRRLAFSCPLSGESQSFQVNPKAEPNIL